MLRRAGGSERERGRARGGGFPLRSGKDATFFLGWGPLLSGWVGGGEGGREGGRRIPFSVQTRSHSQCLLLLVLHVLFSRALTRNGEGN